MSLSAGNHVIVSCFPRQCVCVCVQVEVEEIDTSQHSGDTSLGAVTQSPDTVVLPRVSWSLPSAVVVSPYVVAINGSGVWCCDQAQTWQMDTHTR